MSEQGAVAVCSICPHHCRLREGEVGRCRARAAAGGHVHAVNYGRVTSLALDPIEKKPLYHFHPGSCILSVGSYGCNLACPFCQNHEISQAGARETSSVTLPPARLLALAQESKLNELLSAGHMALFHDEVADTDENIRTLEAITADELIETANEIFDISHFSTLIYDPEEE